MIGHLETAIGAADDLLIRDYKRRFVAVLLRVAGRPGLKIKGGKLSGKFAAVGGAQGELPLVQTGCVRREVMKPVAPGLRLGRRSRDVHDDAVRMKVRVAGSGREMVKMADNQMGRSRRF